METKYTAIIIDDEERARRTLQLMLENFCPNIIILGSYKSVPEGVLAINKKMPNIVFLDIEMPEYNGFELLGFFREITFEIIFVTAYNQYALKAFEVSAVDYLLKPIDGDLLAKAVEKAAKRIGTTQMQENFKTLQLNTESDTFRRIALPVSEGLLFVEVDDIVLLEAEGSYTNVNLRSNESIFVSKGLTYFEDLLNTRKNFYRCHRSYLINIHFIKKLNRNEGHLELDNGKKIPISRDRKSVLEQLLKG
ncbi:MAG: response regulator transcription factor [Saprospiraceae bacterium]|nr:response regulator transcription factor [Saprospiraceae bacterium]